MAALTIVAQHYSEGANSSQLGNITWDSTTEAVIVLFAGHDTHTNDRSAHTVTRSGDTYVKIVEVQDAEASYPYHLRHAAIWVAESLGTGLQYAQVTNCDQHSTTVWLEVKNYDAASNVVSSASNTESSATTVSTVTTGGEDMEQTIASAAQMVHAAIELLDDDATTWLLDVVSAYISAQTFTPGTGQTELDDDDYNDVSMAVSEKEISGATVYTRTIAGTAASVMSATATALRPRTVAGTAASVMSASGGFTTTRTIAGTAASVVTAIGCFPPVEVDATTFGSAAYMDDDVTVTTPTVSSGDLLVLELALYGANITPGGLSGFTLLKTATVTEGSNDHELAVYYKTAGGSEPATFDITWTGGLTVGFGTYRALTNAGTPDVAGTADSDTGSTEVNAPGLTTLVDASRVYAVFQSDYADGLTWAWPGAVDLDEQGLEYGTVSSTHTGWAMRVKSTASATGAATGSSATAYWVAFQYSIPPAGATVYTRTIAGTAASVMSATGTALRPRTVAGTAASVVSALGGSILTRTVAGTAASVVSATGTALRPRSVAGTAAGVVSATGTAIRPRTAAGTAASVVSATGTAIRPRTVAGAGASVVSALGVVVVLRTVAGVAASVVSATGTAIRPRTVAATAASVASAVGTAIRPRTIAATAASVVTAAGTVTGAAVTYSRTVAGTAASVVSATGTAIRPRTVAGAAASIVSALGTAIRPRTIAGTAASVADSSGGAIRVRTIAGVAASVVSATGTVQRPRTIAASAVSLVTITGVAIRPRTIAGTASSVVVAVGDAPGTASYPPMRSYYLDTYAVSEANDEAIRSYCQAGPGVRSAGGAEAAISYSDAGPVTSLHTEIT